MEVMELICDESSGNGRLCKAWSGKELLLQVKV